VQKNLKKKKFGEPLEKKDDETKEERFGEKRFEKKRLNKNEQKRIDE